MAKRMPAVKNDEDVVEWASEVTTKIRELLDDKNIKNRIITNTAVHTLSSNRDNDGDLSDAFNVIGINLKGQTDIAIVVSPLLHTSWSSISFSSKTLQVNIVYAPKFINLFDKYDIKHNAYSYGLSKGINNTSKKLIDSVIKDVNDTELNSIIINKDLDGETGRQVYNKVGIKDFKSYSNSFSFNKINNFIDGLQGFADDFSSATSLDSMLDITKTIHSATVISSFDNMMNDDWNVYNGSHFGDNQEGLLDKTVSDLFQFTNNKDALTHYSIYSCDNRSNLFSFNSATDTYTGMAYSVTKSFELKYDPKYELTMSEFNMSFDINDIIVRGREFITQFNNSNELWNITSNELFNVEYLNSMLLHIVKETRYDGKLVVPINIKTNIKGELDNPSDELPTFKTYISFDFTDSITGDNITTKPKTRLTGNLVDIIKFKFTIRSKDSDAIQDSDTLESAKEAIQGIINEFESYSTTE